jgi:hypothetical protein
MRYILRHQTKQQKTDYQKIKQTIKQNKNNKLRNILWNYLRYIKIELKHRLRLC